MSEPTCCYGEPMRLDGMVWHCPICRAWRWAEMPSADPYLTAREVAALLGISISSVWRYVASGELPPRETWRQSTIAPLRDKAQLLRRRAGPPRNPKSVRYVTGRHRFER